MWRGLFAVILMSGCDDLFRLDAVGASDAGMMSMQPTYTGHMSAPPAQLVSSVNLDVVVPAGSDRLLIVSVELGMFGGEGPSPLVGAVLDNGVLLTRLQAISAGTARCEQWLLVAPPPDDNPIEVMVDGVPSTIHVNAMTFAGVDQTMPVRDSATNNGMAASGDVAVGSGIDDLVESTVSQGSFIIGPGNGEATFLDNEAGDDEGDNAAGSTAPGDSAPVDMTWVFQGDDYWQEIAVSLQPVVR